MDSLLSLCSAERKNFTGRILAWFAGAMRRLPWRETYDPYSVWISEIMLQQTQMERGVRYFNAWMERFPNVRSVAEADEESVLKAWEGLGYYSRAHNLHSAARRIMGEHGGAFPDTVDAIRALPGVGEYTAAAIASIAFNMPVPAVDANVMRIFARICDIDVPVTSSGVRAFIAETVKSLMPEDSPRLFTQALMELGALVCSKNPLCGNCPIASYCTAKHLGTVRERPMKKSGTLYRSIEMATGIFFHQGRVFIQKRPPYGVWAGLWEFPGGCLEHGETPEQALVREVMEETELTVTTGEKIAVIRHSYTTCRVTMHGYFCLMRDAAPNPVLHAATEGRWIRPDETAEYAFPAGHRKLLEHLGWGIRN